MVLESADRNAVGKQSRDATSTAERTARLHGLYAGQEGFHLDALLRALTDDQLRRLCAEISPSY